MFVLFTKALCAHKHIICEIQKWERERDVKIMAKWIWAPFNRHFLHKTSTPTFNVCVTNIRHGLMFEKVLAHENYANYFEIWFGIFDQRIGAQLTVLLSVWIGNIIINFTSTLEKIRWIVKWRQQCKRLL